MDKLKIVLGFFILLTFLLLAISMSMPNILSVIFGTSPEDILLCDDEEYNRCQELQDAGYLIGCMRGVCAMLRSLAGILAVISGLATVITAIYYWKIRSGSARP